MKRNLLAYTLATLAVLGGFQIANAASQNAVTTAGNNNGFAADLYAQLNKASAERNLFMSPYSISAALGMTAQGARGKTAEQMKKTLYLGNQFQSGMAEITAALMPGEKAPFQLSVANALWVDQTFPLDAGFVGDSDKFYKARVVPVDFVHNAEPARKQINTAIAAQTQDKIKDLIPEGAVDSSTALVLTNAIYFKGTWETPFPKNATMDQPFHAAGGKDVDVPMMKSPAGTTYGYSENEEMQVLALPYKKAEAGAAEGRGAATRGFVPRPAQPSGLTMLVILPKKADGLAALEKQATAVNLTKWASGVKRQAVQVFLPRFTMTTQFELSKELQALGMTDAFSGAADFSGISGSAGNKLAISAVVHKAFVDVNEEGTEAAAATGVMMTRTSIMTGNPAVFRADHPFMFVIRHDGTGSILFMGHVSNPKE